MTKPIKGWTAKEEKSFRNLKAQYFKSKKRTEELWDEYNRVYNELADKGFREYE